jgi:hypothetical protein
MRKGQGVCAWARNEGIYKRSNEHHQIDPHRVVCDLCGKQVSASALARASHGKKHVREGTAVTRIEYTYDGPHTIYEPVND